MLAEEMVVEMEGVNHLVQVRTSIHSLFPETKELLSSRLDSGGRVVARLLNKEKDKDNKLNVRVRVSVYIFRF